MDGQLNTSDVIDANQLIGQVFLQPTKTAEFISLDFVITPTDRDWETYKPCLCTKFSK